MHWCSKMTCFVNSINSELLQKEYHWYKILLNTSNECISQKVISFWFIWNKEATRKPGHSRLPVCSSTLVKQSDVRKLRKLKYHSLAGRGTLEWNGSNLLGSAEKCSRDSWANDWNSGCLDLHVQRIAPTWSSQCALNIKCRTRGYAPHQVCQIKIKKL